MSAQPSPEPSLPPDEDPARYLSVPIGDEAPGEPRAHVIERVRGRWCERSAGGHVGAVGGGERPSPRSGATSSALRSNPMFVVHCESPCETRFFVTRQDGGSAADASLELFGLPRVRWNAARRMRGRRWMLVGEDYYRRVASSTDGPNEASWTRERAADACDAGCTCLRCVAIERGGGGAELRATLDGDPRGYALMVCAEEPGEFTVRCVSTGPVRVTTTPRRTCATAWGGWREAEGTDRGSRVHRNWDKNPQFLLEVCDDGVRRGRFAISLVCGSRWLSPSRASDGGKRTSGKRRRELCPIDGAIGFGITCCGSGELITETDYVYDDEIILEYDFGATKMISPGTTDANQFRIVPSCYAPGVEGVFSLTVHSLDACGFKLEPIAPW